MIRVKHLFSVVLMISLLSLEGHAESQRVLIVEDDTPMIGMNHVTVEKLGTETLGGIFTPLIRSGVAVPCSVSKIFSTGMDSQSQITISLFRGTKPLVKDDHALGLFRIVDIRPAPKGVPQIEVTFTVTRSRILLSARDLTHSENLQIQYIAG